MLLRSAWMPAPPDGSEPAMDRTRGTSRRTADGTTGLSAGTDGRTEVADKEDIPSPVLAGQVQRVWISAGSLRGTPCRLPSLAFPRPARRQMKPLTQNARTRPCGGSGPGVLWDVLAKDQSSEAGTPTPRMMGASAGALSVAPALAGSGA